MPVTRLNQAVLYVRSIERSAVCTGALGFRVVPMTPEGFTSAAFLQAPGVPADRLDADALAARTRIGSLDLDREKERYGAATVGGL